MRAKILELIKLVDSRYEHIQQLGTLIEILEEGADGDGTPLYDDEATVAKTTHNSHYDYHMYTNPKFQNPENHIDKFMDAEWTKKGHISCIAKPKLNRYVPTKA